MPELSNFYVLALGFLLGLRHAVDADHIAAVTTFIGTQEQPLRGCWIGLFWGLGHTLALSVAGFAVVVLRVPISSRLASGFELAVAAMLVILGARLIANVHRQWHVKHPHMSWNGSGVKPLLVGLMHGAAGSAALTLLVLSTISSVPEAMLYILIFGVGSMIGMVAVSLVLSLPLYWARSHLTDIIRPIQLAAGLFSFILGLHLGMGVWRSS